MANNPVQNNEQGLSARNKINQAIADGNEVANKVDKIPTAVPGNVPVFLPGGGIGDSGVKPGGGMGVNVPEWDANTPYPLDFVVQFDGRLFASKVADNQGNQPPVGGGETTFWIERSASESSSTPLWAAGVYTDPRAEVYRIESNVFIKYVLTVAEASLPFTSSDFAAELAAGQWQIVGGGGGGGGAATFDDLTDTPANKTGSARRLAAVNVDEDGIEYVVVDKYFVDTVRFIDLETFIYTKGKQFKITTVNTGSGVTATIKLGGTATDYTIGDNVATFTELDITVNQPGTVEIIGELI